MAPLWCIVNTVGGNGKLLVSFAIMFTHICQVVMV